MPIGSNQKPCESQLVVQFCFESIIGFTAYLYYAVNVLLIIQLIDKSFLYDAVTELHRRLFGKFYKAIFTLLVLYHPFRREENGYRRHRHIVQR